MICSDVPKAARLLGGKRSSQAVPVGQGGPRHRPRPRGEALPLPLALAQQQVKNQTLVTRVRRSPVGHHAAPAGVRWLCVMGPGWCRASKVGRAYEVFHQFPSFRKQQEQNNRVDLELTVYEHVPHLPVVSLSGVSVSGVSPGPEADDPPSDAA